MTIARRRPTSDAGPNAAAGPAERAAMLAAEPSATEDEPSLRRVIAERIRETRVYYDLSQYELAAKAGVTRHFISAIERGAQGLDAFRLRRVADVLGLTMDDLFGVTGRNVWGRQRTWYADTLESSPATPPRPGRARPATRPVDSHV